MEAQKTYTFCVSGMHCDACVLLTEGELSDLPAVSKAKASLSSMSVEVTGAFGGRAPEAIARELSEPLERHGYRLSVKAERAPANWRDFKLALPIALGFAALFYLLQRLGLVSFIGGGAMTYGTAFLIGLVASVSSCMAVVGGLLLSLSATFAKAGEKARPQALFHIGRIASFFVLGGAVGALGSAFRISAGASIALGLLVALVMVVLGVNLLDVFPWARRLQPGMPRFIARRAAGLSKGASALTPLLAGMATFFLPCGFTQSMQVYALSTGSFATGGLTMLAFALGTLPVLALISFGSLRVAQSRFAGVFFKSAGLVVIMFGLFNLINALAAAGIVPPVLSL